MSRRDLLFAVPLALSLACCRAEPAEPAPAPASYELVVAPPGARGARAAGTDAAPAPPGEGSPASPESDDSEPESDEDAGPTDAGVNHDAGGGVAL